MANQVRLPGWDASRTDSDPKQVFGAYVQDLLAQGKPYNADAVRAFVQSDPRWELSGSENDPLLRVKQDVLNTWKPGTSMWQDVLGDAGGQNRPQFLNAGGAPAPSAAPASNWWVQNAPTSQGSVGALLNPSRTPALTAPGSVGSFFGG